MPQRRSILLHGLRLVVTIPGALLWTYALNLSIAMLFSARLHAQLASILDRSLAAERLNSAFDLGTVLAVTHRLSADAPSSGSTNYLGLPVYLLCYFVLVPGTLFCYQSAAPSRLPILVSSGIAYFWRFARITILTAIASILILAPLLALQNQWSAHVDDVLYGRDAWLEKLPGLLVILLVAALLRLYFDLVEVYTVQLGDRVRPNGKPDRRVRHTLLPALQTLRRNFTRAYGTFLALTLLGVAVVAFTGRIAAHTLAQPRVWPQFLLAQAGLFLMLLTRFWQRGAETILAADNPIPHPQPDPTPAFNATPAEPHRIPDAQSDPEPAVPSLPEPDPGVFHHEAGTRDQGSGISKTPEI
jgi:hypothetical protein